MRNFPLQTIFKLMHPCNHFLSKSTFLQTIFFFFSVLSSLVLNIFKLKLFFKKKINSAIANHFGTYAPSKL